MKFLSVLLLAIVLVNPSQGCEGFFDCAVSGVANAFNVVCGTIETEWNNFPSAEEWFEKVKNLFAGYPAQMVSTVLNEFCSHFLISSYDDWELDPEIADISIQLRTACNNYSTTFMHAGHLLNISEFDRSKKVVILASGFLNTIDESEVILNLAKAYNCRGDVNFFAVDAAGLVDTLYTWAVLNTEVIGMAMAHALVNISDVVPVENIHLIGHSLGAHIMSAAARHFTELTGEKLPRITGLDPAKPCYNEGEHLSGLHRGDAIFIDVIHSNPGVYGKREAIGDVDFYPDGYNPLPPGCYTNSCAHSRAWQYYAESVYPGNEQNFRGVHCGSMSDLLANKCPGNKAAMGFAVDDTIRGNYFLEINSESPYGLDAKNDNSHLTNECGRCV